MKPDVVLIAGDVFHAVRPPNPAILHAYLEFSRLVRELPGIPIILIAGNHDPLSHRKPARFSSSSRLWESPSWSARRADHAARARSFNSRRARDDEPAAARPRPGGEVQRSAASWRDRRRDSAVGERLDRAPMKISQRDLRQSAGIMSRWVLPCVPLGRPECVLIQARSTTPAPIRGASCGGGASGIRGGKGFIEQDLASRAHRFLRFNRCAAGKPESGFSAGMSAAALAAAIRESVDACEGGSRTRSFESWSAKCRPHSA